VKKNKLCRQTAKEGLINLQNIEMAQIRPLPEKIMQFGEGNFLRAFIDFFVDELNEKGLFDGGVVVVQPIEQGNIDAINRQDGLYTVVLRDNSSARKRIITGINRAINPFKEFDTYMEAIKNPELRFIFSNTTEAGIVYSHTEMPQNCLPQTFPAKITALLYTRFLAFNGDSSKGLVFIPCELIDNNGTALKTAVLRHAADWSLGKEFENWIKNCNYFANTLVDRIVTGYPRDEIATLSQELGYDDELLVCGEAFHFFAIGLPKNAPAGLDDALPFHKAGLNVVYTDDATPYKQRKVRILNGAHTMSVLAAFLCGKQTVGEMMDDQLFVKFLHKGIFEEIIPTLMLDKSDLEDFADAVLDRFANPHIKHMLLSIAANSVSKYRVRVLPSILEYYDKMGALPKILSFSFAALIAFYQDGKNVQDEPGMAEMFAESDADALVKNIFENEQMWGQNLNKVPGLCQSVTFYLHGILKNGVENELKTLINMQKIQINLADNVAVMLSGNDIAPGHKVALRNINAGEHVIKYGYPIGVATADIANGEHVHTHNLSTGLKGFENYEYNPRLKPAQPAKTSHFAGYRRKDGKVGIRNEIWIINTVGCVNKIAEKIAAKAQKNLSRYTNIDGIYTFVHPLGCSQLGDDHNFTQTTLKNMVNHPNAAAVLVLGLGCENNNIAEFKQALGEWENGRVKFINAQDAEDEIAEGIALVDSLCEYAAGFKREQVPVASLVVGLKCGGSDGLSGITANPLVGAFSDMLINHGGTSILTEVPEMFGAETILMNRCISEEIFGKTVNLINSFKQYFINHGQEIYENPSPGNKDGGITTLEEKSLGCTQKGGTCNVADVLNYGEVAAVKGLNLLQGPGNDIVAVTNLAAAGAHLVLFTTGRGTPLGGPVPTVKISSNSKLAADKKSWIDFDAQPMLEDADGLAQHFFEYIISVASGERTCNEVNEYREISIFKDGVIL